MEPMRDQKGRSVRIMANFEIAPRSMQDAERIAGATPAAPVRASQPDPPEGGSPQPRPSGGSHSAPDPIEADLLRRANELLDYFAPTHKGQVVKNAITAGLWPPTPDTIDHLCEYIESEKDEPL